MQHLENSSFRDLNIVSVDLKALRLNIREIKRFIGNHVEMLPVVKSDAYGHGITEVSRILEEEGIWGLAVFDLIEAQKLRKNNIKSKIFLLSGVYPGMSLMEMPEGLIFGITNIKMLNTLNNLASAHNRVFEAHLKVDVGMSRFGFYPDELKEIIKNRNKWENLFFSGLYSHLPCADSNEIETNRQIDFFDEFIRDLSKTGWKPEFIHLTNSSGFINFKRAHYNLIRPGIAIYGIYPSLELKNLLQLKPVMEFKSHIVETKPVSQGISVSYGCDNPAMGETKIGVIPIGYDDGFMRSLSNNAETLVRGKRCPVIGRVCMKAIMVDLSSAPEADIGDEVVIIGKQGEEEITIDELSHKAGTISYELLCLIGSRNKRVFAG